MPFITFGKSVEIAPEPGHDKIFMTKHYSYHKLNNPLISTIPRWQRAITKWHIAKRITNESLSPKKIEPLARETAISTTFSIRKSWKEFNNIDETAGKNLTGWQKDKLD